MAHEAITICAPHIPKLIVITLVFDVISVLKKQKRQLAIQIVLNQYNIQAALPNFVLIFKFRLF